MTQNWKLQLKALHPHTKRMAARLALCIYFKHVFQKIRLLCRSHPDSEAMGHSYRM